MKIRTLLLITTQVTVLSSANAGENKWSSATIEQPIALVTNDGKIRTISSCDEFIMLRQNNLMIKSINVEPDTAYQETRNALTECNLKWQASFNKLAKEESSLKDINEYVSHLPAGVAMAVSNDEVAEVKNAKKDATLKSLRPDLKQEGNAMVSDKNKEKYVIKDSFILAGNDGKKEEFIVLSTSSTEGTYAVTHYYKVEGKDKPVWKLQPVDWNSSL